MMITLRRIAPQRPRQTAPKQTTLVCRLNILIEQGWRIKLKDQFTLGIARSRIERADSGSLRGRLVRFISRKIDVLIDIARIDTVRIALAARDKNRVVRAFSPWPLDGGMSSA